MVRQAAEGLGADDVFNAALDQLQHLPRQEPALAGHVAEGYEFAGHLRHVGDVAGRREVFRCGEGFLRLGTEAVHEFDAHVAEELALL